VTNGFKGLFACRSLVIRTALVRVGGRGGRYPSRRPWQDRSLRTKLEADYQARWAAVRLFSGKFSLEDYRGGSLR
jgi:hypothetical protein